MLPTEVLQQAAAEMCDWHGRGMGIMEMSHRSADFEGVIAQAEADLRELMAIPQNYKVLFLQGGASLQFSMVPLNLLGDKKRADYIVTGSWSEKAAAEARRLCEVHEAANLAAHDFTRTPAQHELNLSADAAYVHLCSNETIMGVEFFDLPDTGTVPLVADMSSHILSRPMDVSRCGLIYAGAQKNIGPAGLVVVIVREDLLGRMRPGMPRLLDYAVHAAAQSMDNTPASYSIYLAGLVFQWLKRQGGVVAIERKNVAKAARLYAAIDGSGGFYCNPVRKQDRSRMNVPFTLARAGLDGAFLVEAKASGLVGLAGHKTVGGMRASIYNAMPEEGVDALVGFMRDFAQRHA